MEIRMMTAPMSLNEGAVMYKWKMQHGIRDFMG
jgi:hypothetical protein